MNFIGIIPARYASTRFPGKPLIKIKGKTMIHRVYEQAQKTLDHVWVATDDHRIENEVLNFEGNVVMTGKNHQSGTDRIAEATDIIQQERNRTFDVVINIQGDEPFIRPEQIDELVKCFDDETVDIATLVRQIEKNSEIFNPDLPKVVMNQNNEALYFSRSPVPYLRNVPKEEWQYHYSYLKHVGMYAYRADVLKAITKIQPSQLEKAESLEQNRWLEWGYKIKVSYTNYESYSIDTPDDIADLPPIP